MKNTYILGIGVEKDNMSLVDKILGIQHNNETHLGWVLEIEEKQESIDYINFFLNILEGKYNALEQIGVTRDMISIWRYYEYDEQCNFEFSPQELKRMGDNGITFCISCWDTGEPYPNFEKVLN